MPLQPLRLKIYTPNTLGNPVTRINSSNVLRLNQSIHSSSLSPPGIDIKLDPTTVWLDRGEVITIVKINPPPGIPRRTLNSMSKERVCLISQRKRYLLFIGLEALRTVSVRQLGKFLIHFLLEQI